MATTKEELIGNLVKYRELIKENTEAADSLQKLQHKIQNTNIKKVVRIISVLIAIFIWQLILLKSVSGGYFANSNEKFMGIPFYIIMFTIPIAIIIGSFPLGNFLRKRLIQARFNRNRDLIDSYNKTLDETFIECAKFTVLPEKYRSVFAVNKMIDYLTNLRADNIKEAINLLEEELHKNNQISMLGSIIINQQEIKHQLNWQSFLLAMK
jgi:hypothetical protein